MASVNGRRILNVLPSPYFVLTSTSPPRASIFDFTTSSPTPRPDTSVTFSAVEKLGLNNKSIASLSVMTSACSCVIVPFSTAFAFTFSVSIPLPSSRTSITTLLPSWNASRKIEPTSLLPRSFLISALSRPWAAEFLNKCIIGSPISSITVLSSSVSSPDIYNSIFLPSFLFRSRIIRGNLLNTLSIGIIRTFITDS